MDNRSRDNCKRIGMVGGGTTAEGGASTKGGTTAEGGTMVAMCRTIVGVGVDCSADGDDDGAVTKR